MSKEKTRKQGKENRKLDDECCPGDFQKIAEMMQNCCSADEEAQGCAARMAEMMERYCGPGKGKTKAEEQKS